MASIKYKDPITGNMQQITMKVADTLPVGTEVEYNGETVPAGWEEVDETKFGDVVVDSIRTKNLLDTAKFVAGSSSVSILDAKNGTLEIQSTSGYYSQANQKISLKANTTYTISYNGVAEQTGSAVICAIRNLADTTTIARQEGSGDKTFTFTTTENGVIIRFMVTAETNTGKTKYTNIQLEEGSSVTPYTPYQELNNQDTDWQDTGWIDDASGVFSYRLLNKVVYIKFNDKQITLTASSWLELGTLPAGQGFRPSQYFVLDGANNGVDGKYTSAVTTTGSLRVRNTTGGTDVINGVISYIP